MSNDNIEVTINMNDFYQFAMALRKAPNIMDRILKEELQKVAARTEGYARELSPRDTGYLEDSIHMTTVEKEGISYSVYVGTNTEYAKYVHEMLSSGSPETRSKKGVGGYRPGRKFLSNAIVLSEDDLEEAMGRAIERVLGEV